MSTSNALGTSIRIVPLSPNDQARNDANAGPTRTSLFERGLPAGRSNWSRTVACCAEEQPGPEQDGDQAVAVAVRDVDPDRIAVLRRAHVACLGLDADVHAVVVVAGRRAADGRVGLLVGRGDVDDGPDDALVGDDDVAGRGPEAEVTRRERRGRVDRGQERAERRRGDGRGGRRHDRDAGREHEPQHARDEHGPGRCAAHRSMVPQGQVGTWQAGAMVAQVVRDVRCMAGSSA